MELRNELLYVLIIYTMTGFVVSDGPGILNVNQLWILGYLTIALIIFVYVINFVFMMWVHINRVKTYLMKRKYK